MSAAALSWTLGVLVLLNLGAFLFFGRFGFPLDAYDTRWLAGDPAIVMSVNGLIAVTLALAAGRGLHVIARRNGRLVEAHPDERPTRELPRSDHEYFRLEAVNVDGRRQGIMIGVSYGAPVYFSLKLLDDGVSFECEADDAFAALNAARKKFERKGWRFLCNGARRNCYAFGEQLQADLGGQVYELIQGEPATSAQLCPVFAPADAAAVGTLAEQRSFFERWSRG